jgi:hypothetical protein
MQLEPFIRMTSIPPITSGTSPSSTFHARKSRRLGDAWHQQHPKMHTFATTSDPMLFSVLVIVTYRRANTL